MKAVVPAAGEGTRMRPLTEDLPSSLAAVPPYVFSPCIFDACRLLTPSGRGEYELPDAVDLLLSAGRSVETVQFDGWRANVNTPADVETAAKRLRSE